MPAAVVLCAVGNSKRTMMNATHATAIDPDSVYHFPRLNGPKTSLVRPEVMRRKIGVT